MDTFFVMAENDTPNLKDRFVVGAGARPIGASGGSLNTAGTSSV